MLCTDYAGNLQYFIVYRVSSSQRRVGFFQALDLFNYLLIIFHSFSLSQSVLVIINLRSSLSCIVTNVYTALIDPFAAIVLVIDLQLHH